jgi:nicotinamide-nucleotide amidase
MDESLIRLVRNINIMARAKKVKIAVAESCTAGMLASMLTYHPCSSEFFIAGLTTYSNEAKTKILSVPETDLLQYGAVSVEVAKMMAIGCYNLTNADLVVSITGYLSDIMSSDAQQSNAIHEIGLVCFGIAQKKNRLLSKLASAREVLEDFGAQDQSVLNIHEISNFLPDVQVVTKYYDIKDRNVMREEIVSTACYMLLESLSNF